MLEKGKASVWWHEASKLWKVRIFFAGSERSDMVVSVLGPERWKSRKVVSEFVKDNPKYTLGKMITYQTHEIYFKEAV
jgi:hypothetical protein